MSHIFNVAVIGYGWAGDGPHRCHQCDQPGEGHRRLVVATAVGGRADGAARDTDHALHRTSRRCSSDPIDRRRRHHQLSGSARGAVHRRGAAREARHRREAARDRTGAEVLAMKKAVAETGVKTCVCFECRYSSQFLATKARPRFRTHRHAALRRGGLLPRHRSVVRAVSVEHEASAWRQRAPDRGLSRARRAAALHELAKSKR